MRGQPVNQSKPYIPSRGLFAGYEFPSRNQYRNAHAQRKGFTNYAAQRRAPKSIPSQAVLQKLSPSEQLTRHNVLEGLGLMRREGMPISEAARKAHTRPSSILRYAGPALTKDVRGRYIARPQDRLLRTMMIPTPEGLVPVSVRHSATSSRIGRYWNAIEHYRDGDPSGLREFRGKSFQAGGLRYEFITDPDTLKRLGDAGQLHFDGPQSG